MWSFRRQLGSPRRRHSRLSVDRDGQRPGKTQTHTILTLVLMSVPDVTTGLILAMLLVRIGNSVPDLARAAILVLFAVPNGYRPSSHGITIS